MLETSVVLGALLIFVVRILSIALSTVRLLIMGRSNRGLLMVLAFIESLTFVYTFGWVSQDLNNPWNVSAYCLGFAAGTVVGTWIEERVGRGFATVNIVSIEHSDAVAEALHGAGFGATRSIGEGTTGQVGLVWAVVLRKQVDQVVKLVNAVDEKAFVTINETRSVSQGFLGYGRS